MSRALIAAILVAVVIGACGGSSSSGAATSADRDRFVGTWTGHYGCSPTEMLADTMVIAAGTGSLDLSIRIHTTYANPDTVTGTLTSATGVNVPEQSMGGGTGTARLTMKADVLEFSATRMGITCGGTDYRKSV
jgi:ABC-type glycerol-3-phosphate transport system substrate-binding protein